MKRCRSSKSETVKRIAFVYDSKKKAIWCNKGDKLDVSDIIWREDENVTVISIVLLFATIRGITRALEWG